jgi:hypothetical protein
MQRLLCWFTGFAFLTLSMLLETLDIQIPALGGPRVATPATNTSAIRWVEESQRIDQQDLATEIRVGYIAIDRFL